MVSDKYPRIRSRVAIVTGASSGIGEETARQLASAGAQVVLAARRKERLERLAEEIRSTGGAALPVPTDLTDPVQITNLVDTTLAEFGKIDILANIAGWGYYDWLEEQTAESLRNQYEVNILGMAELTRQVIPSMQARRSGHIIMMSSYASKISIPPLTVYASTKYAVEGLADGLRRELLPWGIHVTRIHPSGVTGTEFNPKAARDGGIKYKSLPIGRVSKAAVARAILGVIEKPRRSVFLSRLYDPGVVVNALAPGLVDAWARVWVGMKRREELAQNPPPPGRQSPNFSPAPWLIGAGALAAGIVFFLRSLHNN